MEYLQIFPETIDAIKRYSPEDRCYLYEAMAQYAFTETRPEWPESDLKWLVWESLRQRVEAALRLSEARSRAGSIGGRQRITSTSKLKQTQAKRITVNPESETESDIDTETDRKETNKEKRKRFSPPTLDEVKSYIDEKRLRVDPERFVAYYESNGWRVGRNPMKDWKAAVRTWARNDIDSGRQPVKKVVAQQYEQRDYSRDEPEPMPDWMMERFAQMQKEGTA